MENNKIPKGWNIVTYKDVEKYNKKHALKKKSIFSSMRFIIFPTKEEKLFQDPFYEFNKNYWKRNLFPLILEAIFICFYVSIPVKYFVYLKFVIFFLMYIYFVITKRFSYESLIINMKKGVDFWIDVSITALCFGGAIAVTEGLVSILPTVNPVFVPIDLNNVPQIILHGITTLYLVPISEEIFFREGLICNKSRLLIVISSIFSVVLFSMRYAFSLWGIFLVMIWAIPLTWVYIKTKNVYICLVAHFIVNIIGLIPTIMFNIFK